MSSWYCRCTNYKRCAQRCNAKPMQTRCLTTKSDHPLPNKIFNSHKGQRYSKRKSSNRDVYIDRTRNDELKWQILLRNKKWIFTCLIHVNVYSLGLQFIFPITYLCEYSLFFSHWQHSYICTCVLCMYVCNIYVHTKTYIQTHVCPCVQIHIQYNTCIYEGVHTDTRKLTHHTYTHIHSGIYIHTATSIHTYRYCYFYKYSFQDDP